MRNYVLELEISCSNGKTADSIVKSIKPDTLNTPRNCRVEIYRLDSKVELIINCREINDLRALFNSYFSIISSILRIKEEIVDESAKTTTRGTTGSSTVSSS